MSSPPHSVRPEHGNVLLAFIVLTSASVVVLAAESGSASANIKTGGDALWWTHGLNWQWSASSLNAWTAS